MLDLCLVDSRILYVWYVLESIHKFIIELHVLHCLFVRESNKKQRRGKIFQIWQKDRLFHLLDNQVLSQYGPPSCTLQKRPFSPLQFGQEENIPEQPTERRAYWLILKNARMFSIPMSRNRTMDTLITVKITPHLRDT